jgi:glycosyltransferase involved in cell wall biosynthesis
VTTGLSPLKIMEYLACGRAVVSCNVPGVAQLVEGAGVLARPDDPDDFARAIVMLLDDSRRKLEYQRKARTKALAYDWSKVVGGILSFIDSTIQQRR